MNVIREDVNASSAILKVQIAPADYQSKVTTALEKYRKQVKVPGFRPGKVPMGMIQKQYGKAMLAEELNKIVSDSLFSYVNDNKIEILGNPIPKTDVEVKGDFNNPGDFEFTYEIGLAPKIELSLTSKDKFDYVKVKIDADLIGKQIDDLRRRYGKLVASEQVGDQDMILAQFVELNADGTIKEGGILHSSTISMEFVENKDAQAALKGANVGDKIVVNPVHVSRGGKDTAAMLGISEEALETISDKFQMTINEIRQMELAELNQELFDKLFGPGAITTEEELKERIAKDLEMMFANDSDRLLTRSVYDSLVANTKVDLPTDFLKRWIQLSNEKPITMEEIEAQFDGYEKSMKWQLIQGHIFKSNDIKVDQAEALEYTKSLLVNQYAQYGIPAPEDKELTTSAIQVLTNKEESARVYDMLAETKLTEFFKKTVKLTDKMVSYDEFVEIASK
ncbi:MAG: trigger factor [Crocinitomicaceae bacterium]|nr:MAG: trigger factor [Crocinitomicaceae bacterium]